MTSGTKRARRKPSGQMKEADRMEYACNLIELLNAKEKSPMGVVESALTILEFGGISPKRFLEYVEATGR